MIQMVNPNGQMKVHRRQPLQRQRIQLQRQQLTILYS
jgi:hypothetical protein